MIVNSIGVALMLAYTVVFYLFTTRKRDTIRLVSISLIFLCSIMIYSSIEEDRLRATEYIGFIGIAVSLVFFASPLANLAHVVRVKNSESLPFSMIVSSFVVTLLWFVYGNLIGDRFIQGKPYNFFPYMFFTISQYFFFSSKFPWLCSFSNSINAICDLSK